MSVDRLSVTVPSELGGALRMAALDLALDEADRRFGPIDEAQVTAAAAELVKAARRATKRRRRRRRH